MFQCAGFVVSTDGKCYLKDDTGVDKPSAAAHFSVRMSCLKGIIESNICTLITIFLKC